jgi:RIO kinase 1
MGRNREEFKDYKKTEELVLDRLSLLNVSKLIKKGIIANLDYPISTGKEAVVFKATAPSGEPLAVKIYKTETALFAKKAEYIDKHRQELKGHSLRAIVESFTQKEYKNLLICEDAGVRAPKASYVQGNALVMEFLGEGGLPYPQLSKCTFAITRETLEMLLEDIEKMRDAGLAHADISEYNVLVDGSGKPYIIDIGQGVSKAHGNFEKYIARDIVNVKSFFRKHGVEL